MMSTPPPAHPNTTSDHHNSTHLTATYTHTPSSNPSNPSNSTPLPQQTTTAYLTHPLHRPSTSSPTHHPTTTTLHTLHASLTTLQHEINQLLTAEMAKEADTVLDEDEQGQEDVEEEEEDEREDAKDEIMACGVGGRGGERQLGVGRGRWGW
ncbi:hypothetical protein BGX38DRAFT_197252 [Terfezia claveryi]|nr:hypothetical protein BGX38DRAFT_197252 [Terfezia claveryi]